MNETPPVDSASPFEAQRAIFELLSQETRHHIIQTILGHPAHLVSLAELGYYTQKSESTLLDQLETLIDHDIIATYSDETNDRTRDQPGKFYGLAERGVHVLAEFKYLRGIPVLRAIHENTIKPERIQRHEEAPRPDLPDSVTEPFDFDESDVDVTDVAEAEQPQIFANMATDSEAGAFVDLFDDGET